MYNSGIHGDFNWIAKIKTCQILLYYLYIYDSLLKSALCIIYQNIIYRIVHAIYLYTLNAVLWVIFGECKIIN